MLKCIDASSKSGQTAVKTLNRRAEPDPAVRETVTKILAAIRAKGDAAVIEHTKKFDGAKLTPETLRVTQAEMDAAWASLSVDVKKTIEMSHKNVTSFAKRSMRKNWKTRNFQGVEVGEVFQGFERVGIYVPGGTAPLVSTVVMTVTLAKVANCNEVVVCTPCQADGSVNPALLGALKLTGATEVYRIGGIQAVGAMAYGTDTIKPVQKIFGPGNPWVIEAKRQVFGLVAIDQLPGPSEILVLADDTGRPDWIAADILAQAEHGHGSQVALISTSKKLIEAVDAELEKQVKTLGRAKQIKEVLKASGVSVLVQEMGSAIAIANAYSPEHLTLIVRNESSVLPHLRTAGAIFLGNYSPVAVGDFIAGPSHCLPTGGAGKSFPGLTVDQFQRRTSVIKLDDKSLPKSVPLVETFATIEGLDAHARSASIRLQA